MRVVDDEKERSLGREVRAEPVEAVEDRERGIDGRRRRAVGVRRPGEPEEAGRHSGAAVQQVGALELGCLGQQGLEELAHHAEGEVALELRPARAEHAHAALCGGGTCRGEQRGLADPGRPFDHEERPVARAGLGERRLDPRELLGPLEQEPDGLRQREGGQVQDGSGRGRFTHDPGYNDAPRSGNPG